MIYLIEGIGAAIGFTMFGVALTLIAQDWKHRHDNDDNIQKVYDAVDRIIGD